MGKRHLIYFFFCWAINKDKSISFSFFCMRKLKSFKVNSFNSLSEWHKIRNPLRIAFNFFLIFVAKYCPSLSFKRFLLRLTGMKVGENVSVAAMVSFDFFWPELIELGDNCIVGFNATILAHEFLIEEYRIGRVIIGKNVLIGANSTVLAGIEIGDNSIVGAMSLVNCNVPKNSFFAGVPAKEIKKV
jgi:acetyltransferase-like isoleucine patch superfamily enzyme